MLNTPGHNPGEVPAVVTVQQLCTTVVVVLERLEEED